MNIENTLTLDWKNSGINDGDTVLIHSSISNTLRRIETSGVKPSVEIIFESFLRAVGSDGTLVFPLFNFEFTQGVPFDIKETPSHMGALTEFARKHPKSIRTGHPIYSFAVIGKNTSKFDNLKNFSGYGANSPFSVVHELNGKIAVLDLPDQNSMTFYHYVEECCEVPYRYHKTFTAPYMDAEGSCEDETFGLFVRDLEAGVRTKVDPMGELLWEKGIYQGDRPKIGTGLRTIGAQSLFCETKSVIENGKAKGLLYDIEKPISK